MVAKVANHCGVLTTVNLPVPQTLEVEREFWDFHKADWQKLNADLAEVNWDEVFPSTKFCTAEEVDKCVEAFTDLVLALARKRRPTRRGFAKSPLTPG